MNKQQLTNNIWAAANTMRSKNAANEYTGYILGFITYKYLSDTDETFRYKNGWSRNSMEDDETSDSAALTNCSQNNNLSC